MVALNLEADFIYLSRQDSSAGSEYDDIPDPPIVSLNLPRYPPTFLLCLNTARCVWCVCVFVCKVVRQFCVRVWCVCGCVCVVCVWCVVCVCGVCGVYVCVCVCGVCVVCVWCVWCVCVRL